MILDTTFLIDLLRGEDLDVKKKSEELDERFGIKSIASITIMELWRGALQSVHQEKERRKIDELLQSLVIHPFSEQEAKKSGEIEAELIKAGKIVDLEDIMIAGTALVRNEKVLTKNVKHFEHINGLFVEGY